ncbi:MAG: hypothetical protein KUG68_10195 [Flavobacteriaceae bacterium]|nr:hypothetical protein [Flavobacteriaceae bacterium]
MELKIHHLQPVSVTKIIFSIVLVIFSIYLYFAGTFFGIILLGAALKLSLREGFELDLEGKKYRKLYSILGIKFGFWKTLPAIEYISVFKTVKKSRARVIAAEANLGFEVYKINLFYNRNKHIEVYVSDDKENAFKVANHIAMILYIEVYDATIQ